MKYAINMLKNYNWKIMGPRGQYIFIVPLNGLDNLPSKY